MKKIPAALLSLALTASLTAPLASAAGTGSTLPELDGHWSQSAFERWHAYGIVEGDSRGMRPDANMTVGEFAAILSRAMGYTETVENPYADLKGTEWYAPYILQLTAAGILQGDGTNCNAEEPMNRERATVLFARALGIRPTAQPDLSGFVDGKDAADWSAAAPWSKYWTAPWPNMPWRRAPPSTKMWTASCWWPPMISPWTAPPCPAICL